jgi:superfamily II DNA or RNA helicase
MTDQIHLRPWQRAAFEQFAHHTEPDFLAVATPGAGKTTFALACAHWALSQQRRRLVVVAPTSHLKLQWAQAAHRVGLELDHAWDPSEGLARDVHGLVTTYQQIATRATATVLRDLATDAFVILDEIHHAGDERAWGDGVRSAFELAHRRLCLSGTPFRSDTAAIPFVRYADTGEGGEAQPDITYGYADALRDGGVVRPVYFPRFDGLMEWTSPEGNVVSADFQEALDRTGGAQRLRTALSLDGDWLSVVVGQAHERLMALRSTQRDAGGLVIATDQDHARGIARLLRHRFRTEAEVVVSDDPDASRKIADFANGDRPWLVAVRMVSEGVDIPRLRVGVYATTVTTELFFRQAVGRFVRWQRGIPGQKAYVYVPDDPRLRAHAFQIADARRHVLRPPVEVDAQFTPEQLAAEARRELEALLPEQLSLFSVLSATATGVSVHGFDEDGFSHEVSLFDDEVEVPEPDPALLAGEGVLQLPEVPTDAGWSLSGVRSVSEQKAELRDRNAAAGMRIVDRTGWSHGKVHAELNRLAGISSVGAATNDQLERRLRHAEQWLDRLRR